MKSRLAEPVEYELELGEETIKMNDLIGHKLHLHFTGQINCKRCGRVTKKSFAQGFCYPCFMKAPENSECIIRPELCRAHEGEGRDPEWEKENHMQPHIVYLALSSAVKVGVTRKDQVPTRWIDQGAWKAIPLAEVPYRYLAGVLEVEMKQHMTDKTNWQRMLKNILADNVVLEDEKEKIKELIPEEHQQYLTDDTVATEIHYPVKEYPTKVKAINLDKNPDYEGVLAGIKGQYLIFEDQQVINIRKYTAYLVQLEVMD